MTVKTVCQFVPFFASGSKFLTRPSQHNSSFGMTTETALKGLLDLSQPQSTNNDVLILTII
jgi:hypothetical protein